MTVHLEQAAAAPWDVAVVGAGPAGALAARQLARGGRRVLLVDKARFPRWKVCGCCLNLRALSALEAAGLAGLVEAAGGVAVEAMRLAAHSRSARIPLPGGRILSRESLDAALVAAAREAGATVLEDTQASLGAHGPDGRTLVLEHDGGRREARAHVVLAADGLGGRLLKDAGIAAPPFEASRIGAGAIAPESTGGYSPGIVHMACASGGYVGVVRLEDGRVNLAAALQVDFMKRCGGMGPAAAAVLREAGFEPVPGIEELPWRGTPALTRQAARVAAPGFLAQGDCAGYVEPFTGEGMAWALTSALAASAVLMRTPESGLAIEWERVYRRLVRRQQIPCRILAAGFRRRWFVPLGVALAPVIPLVARPFVRRANLPYPRKGFASP